MASIFFSHDVSDLTLGKPPLLWLPLSASISHALRALKHLKYQTEISIWDCSPTSHLLTTTCTNGPICGATGGPTQKGSRQCRCVGKVCMMTVVCYICSDESLRDLSKALSKPVSVLLVGSRNAVEHVDYDVSIVEALDLLVSGIQNLVVPKSCLSQWKPLQGSHNGKEYCWVSHEDVIRFLLRFVGVFSPLPTMSIEEAGLITTDVAMAEMDDDAVSVLKRMVSVDNSHANVIAMAIVEEEGEGGVKLVGELSSTTLHRCDEESAGCIAGLSVRELLGHVEESKRLMSKNMKVDEKRREEERRGRAMDERSCRPWSSVIAVMLQALAQRHNYVWVTQPDGILVGIVTFNDIIELFLTHLH